MVVSSTAFELVVVGCSAVVAVSAIVVEVVVVVDVVVVVVDVVDVVVVDVVVVDVVVMDVVDVVVVDVVDVVVVEGSGRSDTTNAATASISAGVRSSPNAGMLLPAPNVIC